MSLLDSLNQHINTVTVGDKTRSVVMPSNIRHEGMSIVSVKTKPFDHSFSKNKDFYVGENGLHGIKERYPKFKEWFHADNDIPMETSKVNVDELGNVSFDNGRHRYAYLRDNGVKHIPVTMDDESRKNALEHGLI